jgi:hypothetical protein
MEIWSAYRSFHTLGNLCRVYNVLDAFVYKVTVGWVQEMGRVMPNKIWVQIGTKVLYFDPNVLILFLNDIANVN